MRAIAPIEERSIYKPSGNFVSTLILLSGLAITFMAYEHIERQTDAENFNDFRVQALNHAAEIQIAIQHRMTQVSSIGYLFASTDWVTRQEFLQLIDLVYQSYPENRLVSWVPIVTTQNESRLLEQLREEYSSEFSFFNFDLKTKSKQVVHPTFEQDLMAVAYSHPMPEDGIVGRNLHPRMPIYNYIQPALANRQAYASGFREPLPPAEYPFFMLSYPVIDHREELLGVVLSANYTHDVFSSVVDRFPFSEFHYRLIAHDGSAHDFPVDISLVVEANRGGSDLIYQVTVPIQVAGNEWFLTISTEGFGAGSSEYLVKGLTAMACLLSILLAFVARMAFNNNVELARGVEEKTQELEVALRDANDAKDAKGQFLSKMSHEMRTPLNGIVGLTELSLREELDPLVNNYLTRVQSSARHLMELINDVLDFSKIEAGHLKLEDKAFSLISVLDVMKSNFELQCQDKGLEFEVRIDDSVVADVQGDRLRLTQILMNLCSNALKFTSAGSIHLAVTGAMVDRHAMQVHFEVTDTGIGIPESKLKDLFEDFTQADSSTTREYGGTGLGLSIARQLCEMMNGTLTVNSVQGEGSTFTATVRLRMNGQIVKVGLEQSRLHEPMRILVVDDNPIACEIYYETLNRMGAEVSIEMEPRRGLTRLEQGEVFDVVLLDWTMPGLTGLEFLQELDGSESRIVIVSAYDKDEIVRQIGSFGVYGVLTKPCPIQELFLAVQGAMEKEKPVTSSDAKIHNKRILVAEDNEVNQLLVEDLLLDCGAEVVLASNGKEAVDYLESGEVFDLVLMDINMPIQDGVAATQVIRNDLKMLDLPIIALTANVSPEDVESYLANGMNDHLPKPFEVDEFIRKVSNQL